MDRNKKITSALGQSSNIQNIDISAVVLYHLCHSSIQYEIGHFTVMDGGEAGGDFGLIQTFLLYYANEVVFMPTSIFQGQFP